MINIKYILKLVKHRYQKTEETRIFSFYFSNSDNKFGNICFDADRYGLSQLYQIRGRVGRSDKIAYCYLMYNKSKILSDVATKRLFAIKDFTELGSGLSIAMRDLSIRGAGDILVLNKPVLLHQ